jgi:Uma2 family endonuclease
MSIASQRMTLDEFLAKYEHDPVLEYEQGVVTEKMSPGWDHAAIQMTVGEAINAYARPRRLAFAFSELRTTDRVAEQSRIPDISVFVWERIERNPEARRRGSFHPPDIAIEILSPGQSRESQLDRCRSFVAGGSRVALLFEPPAQSVTEVRPDVAERVYRSADMIDLGDIVPGLSLAVGDVYAAVRFE